MMLGTRDEFTYVHCSNCDSLTLSHPPDALADYYPDNYYSYTDNPEAMNALRRFAHIVRGRYLVLGQLGFLGRLVAEFFPDRNIESLSPLKLHPSMSIVDIGCGAGKLAWTLAAIGFEHVLGIDPMIEGDYKYDNGARILKQNMYELEGSFDVVMLHHSFEHMCEPLRVLEQIRRLLTDTGVCLITTPNLSSEAWDIYGSDWVQIDAPRHLFVHSVRSLSVLASRAGLAIERVEWNSTEFQYWGSEQYRRDIPLTDQRSYVRNPSKSVFSRSDIRMYRSRAEKANGAERGDQIAVYLRCN